MLKIEEEYLDELISYAIINKEHEVIHYLSIIRDDTDNVETKEYLQDRIDELAQEYMICKDCFNKLEPITLKEIHSELDERPYELETDGYECVSCNSRYNY